MNKTQETREEQVQIGTQIIESSMPSDINFKPKMDQFNVQNPQGNNQFNIKNDMDFDDDSDLRSFTFQGKSIFSMDPQYQKGHIVDKELQTISVKGYDEQKSEGLKMIWQSIVGYTKRQLYISGGFLYMFEKTKGGLLIHSHQRLCDLVKMFVPELNMIRLVFRVNEQKLKHKNFKLNQVPEFIEKIKLQANIVGIEMIEQTV